MEGSEVIVMSDSASSLYNEALDKLERWDLDAAEQLLRRVLEIEPENAQAVNKLGVVYARREQLEEAEQLFEQAISLDPNDPAPYCNLGNIYAQRDWVEKAQAAYEKALSLDPEYPNAIHNLGVLYRKMGDISKSVELLKRANRLEKGRLRQELKSSPKARRTALVGWAIIIGVILLFLYLTRG